MHAGDTVLVSLAQLVQREWFRQPNGAMAATSEDARTLEVQEEQMNKTLSASELDSEMHQCSFNWS